MKIKLMEMSTKELYLYWKKNPKSQTVLDELKYQNLKFSEDVSILHLLELIEKYKKLVDYYYEKSEGDFYRDGEEQAGVLEDVIEDLESIFKSKSD